MYNYLHVFPHDPHRSVQLEYMAHIQDLGDTSFTLQPDLCGTTRQSQRLEGFLIRLQKDKLISTTWHICRILEILDGSI